MYNVTSTPGHTMNHLAHLFLAPANAEIRVGALLGDFSHGLESQKLPERVRAGLQHHRAVDAFTDSHPQVLAAKTLFSPQRRRFAGIALDVLFDHYLIRHWQQFSEVTLESFIGEVYQDLARNRHLMPERMAAVTSRMILDDWFSAYQDLDTVGFVLDRLAGRIRFSNEFSGALEEIIPNDTQLEEHFLAFFPDLITAAQAESGRER
ncbi:Acyl carrier protein phosphodiesterase [Marinobacter zhejiangensis]|uniref:Acyl carrier protein phosphodiesterase n=2 Tax=Marinobacter zhejiangensis TaxID=488535 RepID=A0A1I4RZ16_9GAMM|nr:Acyl carrier protein phosphodiesterase [Marinobacter zhejiangensis]